MLVKRFEQAGEVRRFPKGRFEVVALGGLSIGRASYEPGWTLERCLSPHLGLVISGTIAVAFDDREVILRAGDLFDIPAVPHDSWVVGDEPYVSLHLLHAEAYAALTPDAPGDAGCFVCGGANSAGLGATFHRGDDGSRSSYLARREHEGWPGVLHGGVLFALMDDAAGWAARYHGQPCVTGRAEITYRKPVLTGTSLDISAQVRPRGRILTATAEARRVDTREILADFSATLFPRT